MERMETNFFDLFGLLWFSMGYSDFLLGLSPFHPFSVGLPLFLVPQAIGLRFATTRFMDPFARFTCVVPSQALGLRYPPPGTGSKDSRLSDSLIQNFFAPSRCCCVQMARSFQACLTSASVNTTRCLVDVLISAWSKKTNSCRSH